jgi:hypothetical protein
MLPPTEQLWLLTLSRCPTSLRDELLRGADLQVCREALQEARCEAVLPCGAFAFVHPHLASYVAQRLVPDMQASGKRMLGRHVICSHEFKPSVYSAVEKLRTRDHTLVKRVEKLAMDAPLPLLRVERTFLHCSIYSSRVTTASTTVVTIGMNPRVQTFRPI